MGLDWIPLPKPRPTKEGLFHEIFNILENQENQKTTSFLELKEKSRPELIKLLNDPTISQSPYETLDAPRVGSDEKANQWAREIFLDMDNAAKKGRTEEQFIKEYTGYYVLDLLPECDGIPPCVSPGERYEFRGKFLDDCQEVLGEDLFEEAYVNKTAAEAVDYGKRLMQVADKYALEHNLQHLKDKYGLPDDDDSPEMIPAILYAASKWLLFWGSRGHGYQASY